MWNIPDSRQLLGFGRSKWRQKLTDLTLTEVNNLRIFYLAIAVGMFFVAVLLTLPGAPYIGKSVQYELLGWVPNGTLLEFYAGTLAERWGAALGKPGLRGEVWTADEYQRIQTETQGQVGLKRLLKKGLDGADAVVVLVPKDGQGSMEPVLATVPEKNLIVVGYSSVLTVTNGEPSGTGTERIFSLLSYLEFNRWALAGEGTLKTRRESGERFAQLFRKVGAKVDRLELPDLQAELAQVVLPTVWWVKLTFCFSGLYWVLSLRETWMLARRAIARSVSLQTWDPKITLGFWEAAFTRDLAVLVQTKARALSLQLSAASRAEQATSRRLQLQSELETLLPEVQDRGIRDEVQAAIGDSGADPEALKKLLRKAREALNRKVPAAEPTTEERQAATIQRLEAQYRRLRAEHPDVRCEEADMVYGLLEHRQAFEERREVLTTAINTFRAAVKTPQPDTTE